MRAGYHDLDEANPANDAEVAEIIIYHGYNPVTTDADIAILRLRNAFTLGTRISVACLPDERDHAGTRRAGWYYTHVKMGALNKTMLQ